MKKLKLLCTIALMAFALAGCGFNNKKDALILVNNEPITKQDYSKAFDAVASNPMFSQMGVDLKSDQNSFLYLMLKDRVVNELIVKKLLEQEMKKRNIKVTDDDINKELKNMIDKVGSKDKFNEILKQNGISAKQFKKDLSEEVKVKKLVDSLDVVSVSDSAVQKYYKQNIDKFKYPDKVRASHILISADPQEIRQSIVSTPDGKKLSKEQVEQKVNEQLAAKLDKANKLLAEVKKDPSQFAKLAKENSDDTMSAKQGGDLGYFAKEEMVDTFSKKAFSMQPNTISDLVKTPYGYHIIMVSDRIKAGTEPLSKVKNEIKDYLVNQEKVKILQKFVDSLKSGAKIVYQDPSFNPEVIQKQIKEQAQKNPALNDAQKSAKD
ncbi:MAG: peptidylprolyl isomerase [Candidatus Gastranaerophilales bacterium]|nr:peptidylprolyl isomerase [Candidatus Gastranaerophilales bacterium]